MTYPSIQQAETGPGRRLLSEQLRSSYGRILLLLAVITVLFSTSLQHPFGRTYPPDPVLGGKPFSVQVEQVEQDTSRPAGQVAAFSHSGQITLFQQEAGKLLIRGRLGKRALRSGRLVIRSSQAIFLISSIRGDPSQSDDPLSDAFLLTVAAVDHSQVRKPCVLVNIDGRLDPLNSSAVAECGPR